MMFYNSNVLSQYLLILSAKHIVAELALFLPSLTNLWANLFFCVDDITKSFHCNFVLSRVSEIITYILK